MLKKAEYFKYATDCENKHGFYESLEYVAKAKRAKENQTKTQILKLQIKNKNGCKMEDTMMKKIISELFEDS